MTDPFVTSRPVYVIRRPEEPYAYVDATMGATSPPPALLRLIKSDTYGGQYMGDDAGLWRIPAAAGEHFARRVAQLGYPADLRADWPQAPAPGPKMWECANPDCARPITLRQAHRARWTECPHGCGETHPPVPPPREGGPGDRRNLPGVPRPPGWDDLG